MISPFWIDLETGEEESGRRPTFMTDSGSTDFLIDYFKSGFNFVLGSGITLFEMSRGKSEHRTTFKGQHRVAPASFPSTD